MAEPVELLGKVRDRLIAEGIVRNPAVAAPTVDPERPPAWLDPQDGVPAPGDLDPPNRGPSVVVAIQTATEIPGDPLEQSEWQLDAVEFIIRAKTSPAAKLVYRRIRTVFAGKVGYDLGGVFIHESLLFRGLQPLVFDRQAFTFSFELTFDRNAKA